MDLAVRGDRIAAIGELSAARLGIKDRRYLRQGLPVDIVVLDPFTIESCADYGNPHCYSKGIEYLRGNGELTLDEGSYTGALGGLILTPRGAIAPAAAGG